MRTTRICFVTPPSAFLLDERVFPNLGILKVAAAAIARGHAVEHVDIDGVANYEDAMRAHAAQTDAPWFALTATTPQMPAAKRVIDAIRAARPDARVILGGPHPTLSAAAVKLELRRHGRSATGADVRKSCASPDAAHLGRAHRAMVALLALADVVVAGDGEDAIEEAVSQTIDGGPRGFVDADDPKGPLFLTRKRLEEVPWPARHLIDLESYHYKIEGVPATTLIAQLGCPFNCSFCGGRASPMLRRARMRSTESVIAEMEHLHVRYGYRGFMLYDDELNVNPKMVELMRAITALQRKHGVEFRLRGFVKSELVTREQLEAMQEAGFRWLLCGFEAGHPRILENIQKKATVEENTRAVELAHAVGLKVKALMSIGHAGETRETIAAVKRWLLDVRVDDFDCTIITPYPGSPYYDEAVQATTLPNLHGKDDGERVWTYTSEISGDRLHAFELDYMKTADYYKGAPGGGYRSYVFTDELSPEELVAERDALERDVRAELGIPFNPGAPGIQFEASMGQTKLPSQIVRRHEEAA